MRGRALVVPVQAGREDLQANPEVHILRGDNELNCERSRKSHTDKKSL